MSDLNPHAAGRRLRLVTFTPEQTLGLLVQSERPEIWSELQVEGIPEGARVIGHGHSLMSNCFVLVVEHESFEPVPLECQPPAFPAKLIQRQRSAVARLTLPRHVLQ